MKRPVRMSPARVNTVQVRSGLRTARRRRVDGSGKSPASLRKENAVTGKSTGTVMGVSLVGRVITAAWEMREPAGVSAFGRERETMSDHGKSILRSLVSSTCREPRGR